MFFFLAALTRLCLVIGKTTKADGIHTDDLNVAMFKAGKSSCSTLSEMLMCDVYPAFKESDEDSHRITLTNFEAMMDCLQHKPFILDTRVIKEDYAECIKSRLIEYFGNDSERLLTKSHDRAHGQTLSCSLSIIVLRTEAVQDDHG